MKKTALLAILLIAMIYVNAQRRPGQRHTITPEIAKDAAYYKNLSEQQHRKAKILLPISGVLAGVGVQMALAFEKARLKVGAAPTLDGIGYLGGAILGIGGAIGTGITGFNLLRKSKKNKEKYLQLQPHVGYQQLVIPHQPNQLTAGIRIYF